MPGLERQQIDTIMRLTPTEGPYRDTLEVCYDVLYGGLRDKVQPLYQIWESELFPVMGDVSELKHRIEQRLSSGNILPTYTPAQAERLLTMLERIESRYPIPAELRGKVEPGIELRVKPGSLKEDLDAFCRQVKERPVQQINLNYQDIGKVELIPLHERNGNKGFFDPFSDPLKAIYTLDPSHSSGLSLKDIPAKEMVEKALLSGDLKPGQPISENSSGNTGVGLALMGLYLGHNVILYTPDKSSPSKIERLRLLGAYVIVRPEQAEFDSSEFNSIGGSITDYVNEKLGCSYIDQHNNPYNADAHYENTSKYILPQLDNITAFIAPVGTSGTIVGLGTFFTDYIMDHPDPNRKIKIICVDAKGGVLHQTPPEERLRLTDEEIAKRATKHGLQGFGGSTISSTLTPLFQKLINTISVTREEAELSARVALPPLGVLGGQSSGAVWTAIQQCLRFGYIDPQDTVLAVLTDLGFPYDFYKDP